MYEAIAILQLLDVPVSQCRVEAVDLLVCISLHTAGTLGFYLRGTAYASGSTVLRTDIGEGDDALQCTTDSAACCTHFSGEMRAGEFYFPNGDTVMVLGTITNGYYRTRGTRHIRLNRQSTGTITGQFRCEIPDASGTVVDLFINISM